ncbi:MAG: sodium:proton antiporter [Lachnospiraceae bacterium]|nr:sodium:proton antiporter [Lachnospiraceae bacterium]MEE3461634.1 sodium:proton antiporter [Lachnospiraceae bacterium]
MNENLGQTLSLLYVLPFVGMLLSIAVIPLINGEWWDKKKPYFVIGWSLLFLIPFTIQYGIGEAAGRFTEVVVGDYLTFIFLLFGLFCVAGNITIKGELSGSPVSNLIQLLIGTLLAGWVGTTGASMLLVRPLLKGNSWRKRKAHTFIFMIFMVANLGGALTPVGDPPLLMGFMRGIPFFWSTTHLLPMMLFNIVILSVVYMIFETRAYKKDVADGLRPEALDKKAQHKFTENVEKNIIKDAENELAEDADLLEGQEKFRIEGAHNIIFLIAIVGAVILSGVLPGLKAFQNADGSVIGINILGTVLSVPSIIELAIILLASLLSFKTTKKEVRDANQFSWAAIEEVAVLFIGIFITMVPALMILKAKGASLGLTEPWQMFWSTGVLSSFLDNTPTYLVFLTTAGALGETTGVATTVGMVHVKMLEAISCGAVFMGANTYIGNAPNFMVCSISKENGVKMPSFFGYMGWSCAILIPVFIIDTLVFFL